jgi:hypothetical protein
MPRNNAGLSIDSATGAETDVKRDGFPRKKIILRRDRYRRATD